MKSGILIKITGALFLVSILTFGILLYYSLREMKRVGNAALTYGDQVGVFAIKDSKNALVKLAKNELKTIAEDQANITSLNLQRIVSQVEAAASFCRFDLAGSAGKNDPVLYTVDTSEQPENAQDFSSFSLAPGVRLENVRGEIAALGRLHNIFKFIQYNDPFIRLIYVGTANGVIYRYPWAAPKRGYDPRERDWYRGAVAAKGAIHWSHPYWSASRTNELTITCSKALYGKNGTLEGVIAADISVKSIAQDFIVSQTKRQGTSFLINSSGEIIAGGNLHELMTGSWENAVRMPSLTDYKELLPLYRKMIEMKSGTGTVIYDGVPQIVGYAPVRLASWSIAIVQSEADTLKPAMETEARIQKDKQHAEMQMSQSVFSSLKVYFAISLFMLCTILLMGYILAKHLTNPIRELIAGARKIGAGNLDCELNLKTGDEIEQLSDTFNSMARDLKNYIANLNNAAREKQRIESDLKAAAEIQTSMLPRKFPPFPERTDLDVYAMMEPAKKVGGDLYDFIFLDEHRLFFTIGDVSGKGMPAALFMATAKTLMRSYAMNGLSPKQILHAANRYLSDENDSCMFITVFCGILDCRTGLVTYANGGHNPPVIIRADRSAAFRKVPPGFPLGPFEFVIGDDGREECYTEQELTLAPGDSIFLYTDGVTEAVNPEDVLFGDSRLMLAISMKPPVDGTPLKDTVDTIRKYVKEYADSAPQSDDITMLLIRYNGIIKTTEGA